MIARALDFFAGSGLARVGLEPEFRTVWANDICPKKGAVYDANAPGPAIVIDSIANVRGADLPAAELAWASFPCQDLFPGRQSNRHQRWDALRVVLGVDPRTGRACRRGSPTPSARRRECRRLPDRPRERALREGLRGVARAWLSRGRSSDRRPRFRAAESSSGVSDCRGPQRAGRGLRAERTRTVPSRRRPLRSEGSCSTRRTSRQRRSSTCRRRSGDASCPLSCTKHGGILTCGLSGAPTRSPGSPR